MDKHWKTISAIAVLLSASAVAYYFVVVLPSIKKQEMLAANQAKCSDMAEKYFLENSPTTKNTDVVDKTNHYNQKLEKCIVEFVDNSYDATGGFEFTIKQLTDVGEKTLLATCETDVAYGHEAIDCEEFMSDRNGTTTIKTDFRKLEQRLMTE